MNTNIRFGKTEMGRVQYVDPVTRIIREIITVACIIILILGLLLIGGYNDTHYTTTAQVYKIEGNSTLLVDGAGYVWEVTNRPDLHKDDFVKVKFFNNTTNYTREDDEIIKITKLDN